MLHASEVLADSGEPGERVQLDPDPWWLPLWQAVTTHDEIVFILVVVAALTVLVLDVSFGKRPGRRPADTWRLIGVQIGIIAAIAFGGLLFVAGAGNLLSMT